MKGGNPRGSDCYWQTGEILRISPARCPALLRPSKCKRVLGRGRRVGRRCGTRGGQIFKRRIASFACVGARCLASPTSKFAGNAFPSFWPRFAGAWARESAAPASKLANIFKRGSVEISTRQRRRSARFVASHAMHLGASAPRNAGGGAWGAASWDASACQQRIRSVRSFGGGA